MSDIKGDFSNSFDQLMSDVRSADYRSMVDRKGSPLSLSATDDQIIGHACAYYKRNHEWIDSFRSAANDVFGNSGQMSSLTGSMSGWTSVAQPDQLSTTASSIASANSVLSGSFGGSMGKLKDGIGNGTTITTVGVGLMAEVALVIGATGGVGVNFQPGFPTAGYYFYAEMVGLALGSTLCINVMLCSSQPGQFGGSFVGTVAFASVGFGACLVLGMSPDNTSDHVFTAVGVGVGTGIGKASVISGTYGNF